MRWIVAIVIVILVVFLLTKFNHEEPPATPTVTSVTPTETPAEVTPRPAPPGVKTPTPDERRQLLEAYAIKRRMKLLSFRPVGDGADLEIQWISDDTSQGADFIQGAINEGYIHNLDIDPKLRIAMIDGRRAYINMFHVKF